MKNLEDYRKYFEEISVVAPLTFSYKHPLELLEILKAKSGLPYFVNRSDFFPVYKQGRKEPKGFKGWAVSFPINKKMKSYYKELGFVHVHLRSNLECFSSPSFIFSKDCVFINGMNPFIPIAHYQENFNNNTTLKTAVGNTEFYINKNRVELKKVISFFGCTKAYYRSVNNDKMFNILADKSIKIKEKERQLKKDLRVLRYSSNQLKCLDLETANDIVLLDRI